MDDLDKHMAILDKIDAHLATALSEHEGSVFHDLDAIEAAITPKRSTAPGKEAPPLHQNGHVIDRFTSRKFLIAIASAVAAILGASGVIDQAQEVTLVQSAVPILYILVQGIADYKGR